MTANETTLQKRPNDTEINNYRSLYNSKQSPYRKIWYKRPWNDNVKPLKREN